MKKQSTIKGLLILVTLVMMIMALSGCGESKTASNSTNAQNSATKQLNAEEIVSKMKSENSNIGKLVVYTEDTDLNKLLGRPGQYTSKVGFEDKRLEQVNANNEFLTEEERKEPTGGTVEVFNNEKDMLNRKKYIESFSTSSMFSQYVYSKGNALLRIDGKITPTQAKEYEELFNKIVE